MRMCMALWKFNIFSVALFSHLIWFILLCRLLKDRTDYYFDNLWHFYEPQTSPFKFPWLPTINYSSSAPEIHFQEVLCCLKTEVKSVKFCEKSASNFYLILISWKETRLIVVIFLIFAFYYFIRLRFSYNGKPHILFTEKNTLMRVYKSLQN